MIEETINKLIQLKLPHMAEALRATVERGGGGGLSIEECLGLMVDREWTERENRRVGRRIKDAKLGMQACIEDLSCDPARGLDKSVVRTLGTCGWVRAKQNVIVTGMTGTGKSYVSTALAEAACRHGYRALRVRVPRLLDQLAVARADGSYGTTLGRLAKLDVLVLDDLLIAPMKDTERRDLLEVLVRAEQRAGADVAEPVETGDAVRGVAHEREEVGHAGRPEPARGAERRLVGDRALATVDLHDALAAQALPEILVRGHDADLIDLGRKARRARGQRVVGLVLAHRPDRDAERARRLFDGVELRPQRRVDPFVALVGGEQIVTERTDRIVERDRDVRHRLCRLRQQRQQRRGDAHRRLRVPARGRPVVGALRVVGAEQLVGSVDEVEARHTHDHGACRTRGRRCKRVSDRLGQRGAPRGVWDSRGARPAS